MGTVSWRNTTPSTATSSRIGQAAGESSVFRERRLRATSMTQGVRVAMLVRQFSNQLHQLVIDQTGLTGQYDFELSIPMPMTLEYANQALREQLGLELVPGQKQAVEYLVVEKVK